MICEVAREVEFDAGHRVPFHQSKCFNPHGHRYRVRASVRGRVRTDRSPAHGMVLDFGVLKSLLMTKVHDLYDHSMIVWEEDAELRTALEGHGWAVVLVPLVPTAENLALLCFDAMTNALAHTTLELVEIAVWETPTCVATYRGD